MPKLKYQNNNPTPSQPLVIRTCKTRYSYIRKVQAADRGKKRTRDSACFTLEMSIPREVARLAGINVGDTMLVKGYAEGFWVEKAGDLVSAEDKGI